MGEVNQDDIWESSGPKTGTLRNGDVPSVIGRSSVVMTQPFRGAWSQICLEDGVPFLGHPEDLVSQLELTPLL